MAVKTVSNTGGNWNATTAWVGGVVPIAGDSVVFTATSGNLTVNVSTANLAGIDFTNYVGTITFTNNINTNGTVNLGTGGYTQAGTGGLVIVGNTTITSNGVIWSRIFSVSFGVSSTITLSDNLSITNNVTLTNTVTASISINGNTLNIAGNFTLNNPSIILGTTTIILNGTGTWSNASTGVLRNNLTINTAGTITISGNVYYNTGTLTYIAGTVITTGSTLNIGASTTLNTSGMGTTTNAWNNVTFNNTATYTLSSNLNANGLITVQTGTATIAGTFSITAAGGLTMTTALVQGTGTTTLNITGGTWSGGGNIGINTNLNGTITVSGSVSYSTGTLAYVGGTITTTGSTLNINASTTLNVGTVNWNNVTSSLAANTTITLSSNFNITGATTIYNTSASSISLSFTGTGLFNPSGSLSVLYSVSSVSNINLITVNIPNNITVTSLLVASTTSSSNNDTMTLNGGSINVTGNLTIGASSAGGLTFTCLGTTNLNLTGTGTWSTISGSTLRNNLTFNTSGTITLSGLLNYNTGTLTYTAGTITVVGSTLSLGTSTLSNLGSITLNNVTVGGTLTINSDLNIGGNFTTTTSSIINNALYSVYVYGNLTINAAMSGATFIIINGTGSQTWSATSYLSNNLTINKTSGTLTVSGNVYYNTGTLTYTAGTVTTTGSTLNISTSVTLDTSGLNWNNITISIGANTTITLSSDFNITGTTTFTNISANSISLSFIGIGLLNPLGNLNILLGIVLSNNINFTINISNNITVTNLTIASTPSASNSNIVTFNGNSVNVTGNLTIGAVSAGGNTFTCLGTTNFNLIGTGTWSTAAGATLRNNLTFNTSGIIILSGNLVYNTGIITYINGKVVTTGSTLNLTTAATLINCHRINFNNVIITSGITITMNEFFSGSPFQKVKITASTTTNYTIIFQDNFEKIAKFVNISNCTLSRPQQLLVITDSKKSSTNTIGIRYINNLPNGIPKGDPSTPIQTTFGVGGILSDPNMR